MAAVRDMLATFSSVDERFGGGYARHTIVQYLSDDIGRYLCGIYTSDDDRRAMFSAAAELTYLVGWKTFDAAHHGVAQRYYLHALRLADEANDYGLAGFILRAMAHQAVDLGHASECASLADSALNWSSKYSTPAASALFSVVKARGLAAGRQPRQAASTLHQAERLLDKVDTSSDPPWLRRMGFGEASIANQTAQALRDLGDLAGAERQFRRAVSTRNGAAHRRIHSLTLANLADAQCRQGKLTEACETWSRALDHMDGLRSARARAAVVNIRQRLSPFGAKLPRVARELSQRAAGVLRTYSRV